MNLVQSIKDWFLDGRLFNNGKQVFYEAAVEAHYKNFAVSVCVDLIANAVSKCEFQTFHQGKSVRKNNYYLWNVQPNQNQNATEFIHDVVTKFFYEEECLIIMLKDQLYIADSFEVKEFALLENIYKNVRIKDYQLTTTFKESEVIHLKLSNRKVLGVINSLYDSYGRLLMSAMNYYRRKNNKRYLIKGDYLRAQDDETQDEVDKLFQEQLKNWFDPTKESVAFQLQEGYELEDKSDSNSSKDSNSRDISNLVHDIIDFVTMGFHIPKAMVKGDLADIEKQVDSFIMFAVSPFTEAFADEINRKAYTKEEFLERTYLHIDTSKIKLTDITQLATALDKLFSIGGLTINGVLEILGENPIDEPFADERYVTKNYQKATVEGGEE
ncbi:MAG: phage portal protein [Solibacillus sp.]